MSGVGSFRDFIAMVFPKFIWFRYREEIVDVIQAFIDGTLKLPDGSRADKLFIALKTQAGKSTFFQLAAAYLAVKFPGIIQGSAMHNDKLVQRFSRKVREFVVLSGVGLTSTVLHNWFTNGGSEFWAFSKLSPPSGMPAHVLYGDDLLGGAEDALNANVADKDIEWLVSGFLKRESPHPPPGLDGRFLQFSVGTRWATSDVQGYWLSLGDWYCLIFPTVFDPARWPIGIPVGPFNLEGEEQSRSHKTWNAATENNCAIHPDWRNVGEGLEPSHPKMTAEFFHASRRVNGGSLSEARIAAIEQQNPVAEHGGGIMDRSWFTLIEEPQGGWAMTARAWDFGVTDRGGDPTTSCKMGRHGSNHIIRHGCRAWLSAASGMQLVAAMMILDGPKTVQVVPVGKADEGKRSLAGIRFYLQQVAKWAGVRCGRVQGQSVSNRGRPENFRSAKHQRCAYPGGSLVDDAKPADWEGPEKRFSVPGSVQVSKGQWRPNFREIVGDFEAKVAKHPELARIEEFARAATDQMSVGETKRLSVDHLPHQGEMIDECHNFSGYDGGADHYVDCIADAKTSVTRGKSGMPWTG